MVKRLIIRLVVELLSSVGKSAMKAYKETASQQKGGKTANPFTNLFSQAMQTANLTHKPMFRGDALKILHIEEKELTDEKIIRVEKSNGNQYYKNFWIQFHKNDPARGGSFYIQSLIFNAKMELMKEFPNADEKEIIKKLGLETNEEKDASEKAEKESQSDEKQDQNKQQ